jgi:hypothetical protein
MTLPEFAKNTYAFKDIPKKRKYLLSRLREIYSTTDIKEIVKTLDSIKIKFRNQKERGASNHKKLTIYLPLLDFDKFSLETSDDVIKYLESPKSTITHETNHIFQNLAESFPDVQYLEKKPDGEYEIDYDKYWDDPGEKQSRLEQVRELLNWGLTKPEIIQFLYNRKHDDRKLWSRIIDEAIKETKR